MVLLYAYIRKIIYRKGLNIACKHQSEVAWYNRVSGFSYNFKHICMIFLCKVRFKNIKAIPIKLNEHAPQNVVYILESINILSKNKMSQEIILNGVSIQHQLLCTELFEGL